MTLSPRVKSGLFLAGTLALCTVAAAFRWPDSAHAMGVVKQGGGAARHAVNLPAGPDRYQIVLTAPVLPPWRGDARITLEGAPDDAWTVALTAPIVDLHLRRWPRLEGKVLRDLAPGDKLALWLDIAAPAIPAGGHSVPSASGEGTSRPPEPPLAPAQPHPAGPPLVTAGGHSVPAGSGEGASRRPEPPVAATPHGAAGVDPVCGMACAPGLVEGERCFCSEACRAQYRANPARHAHGHGVAAYRLVLRDEATNRPVLTVPVNLGGEGGGHGAHH